VSMVKGILIFPSGVKAFGSDRDGFGKGKSFLRDLRATRTGGIEKGIYIVEGENREFLYGMGKLHE